MDRKSIREADFYETGYSYTLSLIAGKYKPIILYCLMEYEPVRFNEMQRYLKKVADKTLSQGASAGPEVPDPGGAGVQGGNTGDTRVGEQPHSCAERNEDPLGQPRAPCPSRNPTQLCQHEDPENSESETASRSPEVWKRLPRLPASGHHGRSQG